MENFSSDFRSLQRQESLLQYINPNNHCILGDARCLFSATVFLTSQDEDAASCPLSTGPGGWLEPDHWLLSSAWALFRPYGIHGNRGVFHRWSGAESEGAKI